MNKMLDERLVPQGEYIHAENIRVNSSNGSNSGTVENTKGNRRVVDLKYKGAFVAGITIGAFADESNETIYWFVAGNVGSPVQQGPLDMIVSYNVNTQSFVYHVVTREVLNFDAYRLITAVDKIGDFLFFSDNYNPPRKINVTRSYPQPNDLEQDQITEDDISVIVKPPFRAPSISLINTPGDEDFLETRMIAFAYRYKYLDGEYSALSQFSKVAFQPKPFFIDTSLYLNGGMESQYNTALVTFNTGPSNVVGIDVCFKYSDDNTVRVIDKYVKFDEGWANNVNQTIAFTNKKIYTILPESEVLRLYDNVPRLAQAQTIMGNRLMYGNYLEGYDLVTSTGSPIRTNFKADLITVDTGYEFGEADPEIVNIAFDVAEPNGVGIQAGLEIDLSGIELTAGSSFGFNVNFAHHAFAGQDLLGSGLSSSEDAQEPLSLSFIFYLNTSYDNAVQMVNSTAFKERIGTNDYVQAVDNCSNGVTFADTFNCAIVPPAGFTFIDSGYQLLPTVLRGIRIITGASDDTFTVAFPALQYASSETPDDDQIFEYLKVTHGEWFVQTQGDTRSLHSNRDYEVGIVYMDDYKRATTALVSNDNTVYVPASASDTINKIRVTIPTDMTPPEWATNYKFVLKPTEYDYETVYTSFYYPDPNESVVWMKLEGDNQRKVEVGDQLIVKSDANGPLNTKRIVSVLDKTVFERDKITEGSLPGVYMRIKPTGITVDSDNAIELGCNELTDTSSVQIQGAPKIAYPVFEDGPNNTYVPWAIPAGSQVKIYIKAERENRGGCGGNCGAMYYLLEVDRVASQDYATLKEFWEGEDIDLSDGITDIACADADNPIESQYYSTTIPFDSSAGEEPLDYVPSTPGTLSVQFAEDTDTEKLYLLVYSGIETCVGFLGIGTPNSELKVEVCVRQAMNPVVFETLPIDAQPDIFFESSDVYLCNETGHKGNVQNQVVGATPGIVDLDFFNCYCFGNGVESYKVKDAVEGHSLSLGERVTSTSAQDYKETRRFADITYSGIFNDESNVNKLNEFNLGLANFKALEDIYGPIQILDGRKTDILVLQEDKISYVLSGKNLLSDAAAGGALTSVPEVLGTQIARVEEYGISYQPESFAKYGYDKFFTDTKRGAVLNLRGSSASDEQLAVISDAGMKPYFRQEFISGLRTQKIGAYDPYHGEYVLHLNGKRKYLDEPCYPCGTEVNIYYLGDGDRIEYCFGTGGLVGEISIEIGNDYYFDIPDLLVTLSHGNNSTGPVSIPEGGTQTLTIEAVDPTIEEYTLSVSGSTNGYFIVKSKCPEAKKLNVTFITITSDTIAGQTIHNEMYWFTEGYTSPTYNDSVEFLEGNYPFVISKWQYTQGVQGFGTFPQDGSTVRLVSNRTSSDSFEFDYNFHRLYAVRSNSFYSESIQDAETLLNNAELLTPINISGADTTYYGDYEMPVGGGDNLYLIYDYRDIHEHQLCFGERALDACCGCLPHVEYVPFRGSEAVGYGSLDTACSSNSDTNEYVHDGTQEMPEVGDYIYTSNTVGEDTTYTPVEFSLIKVDGLDMLFKTGSSGVVLTRTACDVYEADFYTGAATASEAQNTTGTFTVYSPQDISSLVFEGRYLFTNNVLQTNLPPAFYKHVATGNVVEVGPYGKIISVE
jgi:hypothetical protein